jgi:hypothetical protein
MNGYLFIIAILQKLIRMEIRHINIILAQLSHILSSKKHVPLRGHISVFVKVAQFEKYSAFTSFSSNNPHYAPKSIAFL